MCALAGAMCAKLRHLLSWEVVGRPLGQNLGRPLVQNLGLGRWASTDKKTGASAPVF